jgi:hypothetical protein
LASGDGTYPDANAGGEAEDVGDDDTTGGPSIVIRDGEAPVINRADDCATVPYSGTYICYAWNGDNSGPHTYEAANLIFDALEGEFTEAEVVASDAFDDFVADVQPFLSYLPIVEKEIVDSWIYGASADPIKVSRARAMYRARAACHEAGKCTEADEPNIRAFDRLMLKISEHTWGWWGGTVKDPIANNGSYSNEYLQEQIKVNKDYVSSIKTWEEQRNFIANAVASLGGTSDFAKAVAQEVLLAIRSIDDFRVVVDDLLKVSKVVEHALCVGLNPRGFRARLDEDRSLGDAVDGRRANLRRLFSRWS